ncbi:AAA family ATPase, partial [Rhodovulum sulfidophilum]|uniref:AAA family ATPase n=1 Tax=Rhodovulum sulfidophilum TaxID=35806 RepID=UPI001F191FA2
MAKFASIRTALIPEGVVVRSFFISAHAVSSLRATGKAQKVEVLEVKEFREKFVGKESYEYARRNVEFGSALDPYTNKSDTGIFVDTGYIEKSTGRTYSVDEISQLLTNGKRIILLGEFGTGKSRCAKEVFEKISRNDILFPTLAINLREHWGHQSFDLIVRSHLSSLGLSGLEDSAVRLVRSGALGFILDGIDEIGSQSWSGEPERLKEIRRRSLQGVRDIVSKLGGKGVLLCGRAHYFSNDEEMLSCLGLKEDTILLSCPEEFTEDQAVDYLRLNTGLTEFPEWSPRKPLICQLFSKLEPETMRALIEGSSGEVDFFEKTFQAICERETRIHPSIDSEVLRKVLLGIATASRRRNEVNEEISPVEINEVFHKE